MKSVPKQRKSEERQIKVCFIQEMREWQAREWVLRKWRNEWKKKKSVCDESVSHDQLHVLQLSGCEVVLAVLKGKGGGGERKLGVAVLFGLKLSQVLIYALVRNTDMIDRCCLQKLSLALSFSLCVSLCSPCHHLRRRGCVWQNRCI